MSVATLIGSVLNFLDINLIQGLIWSAITNGLISMPLLAVLLLMGKFVIPKKLAAMEWTTTAVMAAAAILTTGPG